MTVTDNARWTWLPGFITSETVGVSGTIVSRAPKKDGSPARRRILKSAYSISHDPLMTSRREDKGHRRDHRNARPDSR